MSASYSYPLAAKVISEFVAMTLTIFFGESILADELLKSTKGHGMGILAVAIGFGLAFGIPIAWFGFISAHINPGMFFFLALIGKVSWEECFACSAANFLGAFFGACLVAVFYYPHFNFSLPLPSDTSDEAMILDGPVAMEKNAGRIASAFGRASRKAKGETLKEELRNAFKARTDEHYWAQPDQHNSMDDSQTEALLKKMEMRYQRRTNVSLNMHGNSIGTIQVGALLHNHDGRINPVRSIDNHSSDRHSIQVGGLLHVHDEKSDRQPKVNVVDTRERTGQDASDITQQNGDAKGASLENGHTQNTMDSQAMENRQETTDDAFKAAILADQRAKLSIFATRPAIFNRPFNFYQEMFSSFVLYLGAELFNLRSEFEEELTGSPVADGAYFQSFYVAFFISMLILGPGGVTGLAANPARDLGPRFAHYVLPIPGKGPSEWNYGLIVPLFGPLTGSCIAAAVFKGMEALFEMAEVDDSSEL